MSNPKLSSNNDFVAHRAQGFADKSFIGVWSIDFGGVKKCDAAFDRVAKERGHLLDVGGVAKAAAHAPSQPRPSADTSKLLIPSLRFCILFLLALCLR